MLETRPVHAATRARGRGYPTRRRRATRTSPPASFDAVVSRYPMWTLREPETAVANWIRLLRPGGTVAVVDSPWFPDGLDNASEDFAGHYDEEVLGRVAAGHRDLHRPDRRRCCAGRGCRDVTVTPLTSTIELDRTGTG